jgi:hypothetical protein
MDTVKTTTTVPDVPAAASIDEQIKLATLQSAQLELQLKKEELAAKRLEIEERKASIGELRERQSERENALKQAKRELEDKARVFNQDRIVDALRQEKCNHQKGGLVSPRDITALHTGGDSPKKSIIRHRMIDGSMWIRCTRCRKSWFPPVRIKFYFDAKGRNVAPKDGVFDNAKYLAAIADYQAALKMTTSGHPSSSVICSFHKWEERDGVGQWVDGTEAYREQIANTNLR